VMTDGGTTGRMDQDESAASHFDDRPARIQKSSRASDDHTHEYSHDHFVYSDVNDVQQTAESASIDI